MRIFPALVELRVCQRPRSRNGVRKMKPRSARSLLAFAIFGLVAGCGGGGGDSPAPAVVATPADPFAAVDQAAATAFRAAGTAGMALQVYDRDGRKVFEKVYGDFAADRRVAVASATKLVTGLAILRLVEQGFLSLDSTTGAVLGWSGPQAAINLRQLLSFTSGLPPTAPCTAQTTITLDDCAAQIATTPLRGMPASRFDYGNTHLQVAARMAEVATGSTWNAIVAQQLRLPLALPAEFAMYTTPRQALGTSNPLVAGGLRATMNEYARVLELAFARGRYGGVQLINTALMDLQSREPFPSATIGFTPLPGTRYGLAAWLECGAPAAGCATISSPGAFGFTPWLDREVGYYAILGMEVVSASGTQDGVVDFAVQLSRDLRPLIRTALSR